MVENKWINGKVVTFDGDDVSCGRINEWVAGLKLIQNRFDDIAHTARQSEIFIYEMW